jgi:hypothetical protein
MKGCGPSGAFDPFLGSRKRGFLGEELWREGMDIAGKGPRKGPEAGEGAEPTEIKGGAQEAGR